jgi:hypothetical protein
MANINGQEAIPKWPLKPRWRHKKNQKPTETTFE